MKRAPHSACAVLLLFTSFTLLVRALAQQRLNLGGSAVSPFTVNMGFSFVVLWWCWDQSLVFCLLNDLAHRLVRHLWHDEQLHDQDKGRYYQVDQEESFGVKLAISRFVENSEEEEQSRRGVEGARQQGKDQARMLWKRIRKLKGGDEAERATEGEEEVARNVGIDRQARSKAEQQGTYSQQHTANDSTDSRAIGI